jgi:hypothetical protein
MIRSKRQTVLAFVLGLIVDEEEFFVSRKMYDKSLNQIKPSITVETGNFISAHLKPDLIRVQ